MCCIRTATEHSDYIPMTFVLMCFCALPSVYGFLTYGRESHGRASRVRLTVTLFQSSQNSLNLRCRRPAMFAPTFVHTTTTRVDDTRTKERIANDEDCDAAEEAYR